MSRVRRFDDIDTDSDFDAPEEKGRPSHQTLSFKTEATNKVQDDDTDTSSILFGSEDSHPVEEAARPTVSPKEVPAQKVSTPVNPPVNMPVKRMPSVESKEVVKASPPTVPFKKIPSPTTEAAPQSVTRPVAAAEVHSSSSSSSEVARPILPKSVNTDQKSAILASSANDTSLLGSQDVLFRAKLRLEEKRASSASATPRGQPNVTTPLRVSQRTTPVRRYSPEKSRPLSHRSVSPHRLPPKGPDTSGSRLDNENARLHEEIQFLRQENKKLRSATSTADSAENIKSELTLDMLRRQMLNNEQEHYAECEAWKREKEEMRSQLDAYVDQAESSAAACAQYKSLYDEKVKEIENVKGQFQQLLQDVHHVEQRQKTLESQHAERLQAEREKGERVVQLLEDAKLHRDQLQGLVDQLQKEITALKNEKKQARDELATEKSRSQKLDDARLLEIDNLRGDVQKMQQLLQEKDKSHDATLREFQRVQDIQLKRATEETEERDNEIRNMKAAMDALRSEFNRTVKREKQSRSEAEMKIKEMALSHKSELENQQIRITDSFETTIKKLREDLKQERQEKEVLTRDVESVTFELEQAGESVAYYQSETKHLSDSLQDAEHKKQLAETKCGELTNTLEELLTQDDFNASTVNRLRAALETAQDELDEIKAHCGSSDSVIADIQRLSDENERLTNECVRLKEQRDNLADENGKIAEELLNWKEEMRHFVGTQMTKSTPKRNR